MWRLFPKSWFSDARPVSRAQSAAVDALYAHWRSWLGAALSRVLRRPISPDAAVEALWCLDAKHFPALDHALRIGYWDSDLGPAKRGLVPLAVVSAANAETEAYLFTAACDANGFIREQALVTFRQFPGRLAASGTGSECLPIPEKRERWCQRHLILQIFLHHPLSSRSYTVRPTTAPMVSTELPRE